MKTITEDQLQEAILIIKIQRYSENSQFPLVKLQTEYTLSVVKDLLQALGIPEVFDQADPNLPKSWHSK